MAPVVHTLAPERVSAEEYAVGPGDHNTPHNPHPLDGDTGDRLLEDLRKPLAVVSGYAQLLQRRLRQDEEPDATYLLARLATIEEYAARIEARLQKFEHDGR